MSSRFAECCSDATNSASMASHEFDASQLFHFAAAPDGSAWAVRFSKATLAAWATTGSLSSSAASSGSTESRVPQAASASAAARRVSRPGSFKAPASAGAASCSRSRASRCAAEIFCPSSAPRNCRTSAASSSRREAFGGSRSVLRLSEAHSRKRSNCKSIMPVTPGLLPRDRCGSPWPSSFTGGARRASAVRPANEGAASRG